MRKIYVAASFAYEDKEKTAERKFMIESIVDKISKQLDGEYFVPHKMKIENAWNYCLMDWSKKVYEEDLAHLKAADIVLFISFGKENNSGSVWEVGYAAAMGKMIIVIKMTDNPESLMISNSAHIMILANEIDEVDWVNLPAVITKLYKLS